MFEALTKKRGELLKEISNIDYELKIKRYDFARGLHIGQKVTYMDKERTVTSLETFKSYPLSIKVILDFECNVSEEAIDSLELIKEVITDDSQRKKRQAFDIQD